MAEWGKISSLFRLEKVLRPEQFDATSMVTLPNSSIQMIPLIPEDPIFTFGNAVRSMTADFFLSCVTFEEN